MSMRNFNPHADYVILLWCRECGHLSTRQCVYWESLPEVRRRATCGQCRSRDIGARKCYEPKLGDGFGLHIWELRLIARACTDAAKQARRAFNALPYTPNDSRERELAMLVAIYERLAGNYLNEARQREAVPMHVIPQSEKQ